MSSNILNFESIYKYTIMIFHLRLFFNTTYFIYYKTKRYISSVISERAKRFGSHKKRSVQ
ncbi:hypothetical protein DRQ29_04435 [bacterium]|nr:MAG: hypothetical protein DRQ29_04435 [bacterium]